MLGVKAADPSEARCAGCAQARRCSRVYAPQSENRTAHPPHARRERDLTQGCGRGGTSAFEYSGIDYRIHASTPRPQRGWYAMGGRRQKKTLLKEPLRPGFADIALRKMNAIGAQGDRHGYVGANEKDDTTTTGHLHEQAPLIQSVPRPESPVNDA